MVICPFYSIHSGESAKFSVYTNANVQREVKTVVMSLRPALHVTLRKTSSKTQASTSLKRWTKTKPKCYNSSGENNINKLIRENQLKAVKFDSNKHD